MREFLKYGTIDSRESYDFYRKNREKPCKGIDQYNYFVKAVNGLFSTLKELLADSKGGIYISGFGYLCMVKYPKKRKKKKGNSTSLFTRMIKQENYFIHFFPDEEFKDWCMDDAIVEDTRKIIQRDIDYKLNFDLCESEREATAIATLYYNNRYGKKLERIKEKIN